MSQLESTSQLIKTDMFASMYVQLFQKINGLMSLYLLLFYFDHAQPPFFSNAEYLLKIYQSQVVYVLDRHILVSLYCQESWQNKTKLCLDDFYHGIRLQLDS